MMGGRLELLGLTSFEVHAIPSFMFVPLICILLKDLFDFFIGKTSSRLYLMINTTLVLLCSLHNSQLKSHIVRKYYTKKLNINLPGITFPFKHIFKSFADLAGGRIVHVTLIPLPFRITNESLSSLNE